MLERVGSTAAKGYGTLIRFLYLRPVSIFVLFAAILLVGILAYPRIPLQLLPGGLSSGECGVFIPVPDATPQEVMEQIAKPCEDFLRTLPGLRNITSSSSARRCFIRLEFDPRYDLGVMVPEIRDRIDRARSSWPEGVDRYYVWRHRDSEMPAYIVSVGLEIEEERRKDVDLDFLFDEVIRKRFQAVPGVARVHIWGLREQRIEVALDKERLEAYGIDVRRLITRLAEDNRALSVGPVYDGEKRLLVRLDGRFRDAEEVLAFPVGTRFRLGDFAEVRTVREIRDRLSRVNGQLSRVVVIHKESGANAVAVCRRLEQVLQGLQRDLKRTVPGLKSIQAHAWLNQGEMITASIASLRQSGLFGGVCAMIVLLLFFRRPGLTLLVTLAIPFSLLITLIWIYFSGGSFNLLSLMGLSLAIGMLVDNSIVVVESILRKLEGGLKPREAAIEGVREVALAVSLATLTTAMVFLPLIFLADARFRKITGEIGLPLCISIFASLLVALVFIPHGAMVLAHLGARWGAAAQAKGYSRLNTWTVSAVERLLGRRFEAFAVAGVLLFSMGLGFDLVKKADFSMEGPRRLQIRLELPEHTTLEEANETFARVEEAIQEAAGDYRIRSITSWFDAQGGEINIFPEPDVRVEESEFFARIGPHLPRLPGVEYHLGFEDFARDKGGQRLRVFLEGNDYRRLEEAAEVVLEALRDRRRFPELTDVARWREDERDEVQVRVDRKLARQFGVDTATVARMVSWALRGAPLPDFVVGGRELPFWIRYSDADKESLEELETIRIYRPDGSSIPLRQVARLALVPGSGEIHRRNGRITIGFSAHVNGDPFLVRKKVEYHLRRLALPEGCEVRMNPDRGGFQEDMRNTFTALVLAVFLVFFVMGVLFESWIQPLAVLCAIPFALFGAVWFLVATQIPLDAVGMIGGLMLVGIVVNNAIVLVDYINRLRARGLARHAALREAVRVRFRPIWMTALTTIFGLMPLLILPQRGEGADYKALAAVLVGGLATSTFFTLLLVPLLYSVLDDVYRWACFLGLVHRRPRADAVRLKAASLTAAAGPANPAAP